MVCVKLFDDSCIIQKKVEIIYNKTIKSTRIELPLLSIFKIK